DTDLTWKGDWPQFTPCFQHTVLVWIPCGYLWITSLFYVIYLSSRPKNLLPHTLLFLAKVFTAGALFVLRVVQMIYSVDQQQDASQFTAEVSGYVIHLVTLGLVVFLLVLEKRKGVITSLVLFFFWFIAIVVDIIPFYTKIILENGNREVAASVLSRITFWWINRLLVDGYKGLKEENLCPLNPRDTTATTLPVFQARLQQEINKHKTQEQDFSSSWFTDKLTTPMKLRSRRPKVDEKTHLIPDKNGLYIEDHDVAAKSDSNINGGGKLGGPTKAEGKVSILRVILKTFWWQILTIHSLMILQTVAVLSSPLLLREMIEFTEQPEEATWKGYVYAVGMFVTSTLQSLAQHICLFYTTCLAIRVSASITSTVYRKALTMNSEARRESTVGEIVNLMSVDARNLEMYTTFSFWMWMSPVWTIVALYLLYTTVGVSMFAGLAFMVVLFTANTVLMNKLRLYQKAMMKVRDKRVKVINEVLNGIKILKLYAWEPSFEEKVTKIREEEVGILLKSSIIDSFLTFAWTAALYWMTLFTFMTFVYVDNSHYLNASISFVALSYFNIIKLAVNVMPIMIREGVKCIVSIGRIDKFLNTPDLDTSTVSHDPDNSEFILRTRYKCNHAPEFINVRVERGSLVAVVGQVGAGKSSLLSAMLGEMEAVSGTVNISGSVAYVPQQAWIQNDSLRNNVLFGREMDADRYDEVLDACALKPDLEILAAGDETEIGEKGINLSGGQKQRVSVARAVYSDADVILLDDPLSAVDSHVGKHIFQRVVADGGMLDGKTRILVTHGLQWLPKVDRIVVMTEVQEVKREMLQRLVSVTSDAESSADESTKEKIIKKLQRESESDHHDVRRRKRSRGESESSTVVSYRRHDSERKAADEEVKVNMEKSKLIEEESVESGRVSLSVYMELARALGGRYALLMLVLFTIYNIASLGGNLWLSAWTDDTELSNSSLPADSSRRQDLNSFYLGVYAALGVAQTVFVVIYSVIMAFRHIHASKLLHRKMLQRLLRAPMSFFDTTPLGRIVNRFSQDMDMMDNEICLDVEIWVDNVEKVLSTVVAISYTTPIFLAVFAPAFIIYYVIMRYYIGTSCQIRRYQSKKRSPIYSHFGESLTGAHVIRAYGAQQRFIQQSEDRVDACQTCTYNANAAARWLGVRLDFVGSLLILAAALFTVGSRDTLSAGVVGLSLTYAMQITGTMNMVVRISTEMETNIVSVERIAQYTRVSTEAPWTKTPRPRPDWPQHGRICFHDYSTRYRPGLDLVLHQISCDIKPGEKVGIVGRTGAGKSSLTLAMFRLIEAAGGRVTVDDVDIASVGLHDLRQNLNILPQDPVIFDGTIRMNLDPFGACSDQQIWVALEQAHLKQYVQGLPDQLDHTCGEGGENLSVGQRQLLCLARALLRKTKILVLDEATAAVDMETDDVLQQTIRKAFADCTVMTIAHRINTVMDYDRILVLDGGKIAEFDSPTVLLQDPNSAFYKMAKDAGLL
ncbi:hypothetical protein BaRGS_00005670, partial [Batillaria attramentaria]